jgi:hypothetical protein
MVGTRDNDVEKIMQTEKEKYHMFSLICRI